MKQFLSSRDQSLDIFRGWTIAGMLLVNGPGHSGQLTHARWEGLHFADVIFPFFIFIVGVSIAYAKPKPLAAIAQRAVTLLALGILLNFFMAHGEFVRFAGVLQRIAVVYAIVALITPRMSNKLLVLTLALILFGYWLILCLVPVPGGGTAVLLPGQDIAAWLDRTVLPGRLYRTSWDPEGLLSTLPAVASGMLGVAAGRIMMQPISSVRRLWQLMAAGIASSAVGYLWSLEFPLIKALWTSSFVLITSGLAMLIFGAIRWRLERSEQLGFFTRSGVVLGTNATVAYLLHEVLATLLGWEWIGQEAASIWGLARDAMLGLGWTPEWAALLYSLAFIAFCFQPIRCLYRRRVFFKI